MSAGERKPKRIYFQIKEVAPLLGVKDSAVRYWIEAFKLDVARHSTKDSFKFTEDDVRDLLAIRYLLKNELFTVDGAKIKLKQWSKGDYVIPAVYTTLPDDLVYSETETKLKKEKR